MKNTVKKLEKNIIKALTIVCESAKQNVSGFEWLTHTAEHSNFPSSLVVTCVFDTNIALEHAKQNGATELLVTQIQQQLLKAGILLKQAKRNVRFDSDEAGAQERLL